jgi:GntR family transcriptional regulator, carbon starvation induced regulator
MAVPDISSTLADRAYERLKNEIIRGVQPPGTRLAVKQLSEAYDIGASPIREALARLVGEGLVLVFGQRGFRVPPIDRVDLWDVTNTRVLIESEALRQSIESGDDAWEAGVVATYHQLEKFENNPGQDFAEWEQRNRNFHEVLVSACPSRWLQRMREILHDQHRRYRFLSTHYAPSRDVAAEHRALRDASLAGDVRTASDILRVHIERTAHTVERALERGGETPGEAAGG